MVFAAPRGVRRPPLARALAHPFLTGRPAAGRLPGEEPRWDVFVSYRVASDSGTRALLVAALEAAGLRVWSDARLAEDSVGDSWRDAFCDALASCRVFVPIVSRGAVNAGAQVPARHWPALTSRSPCDNVLLEHRLALELREQGMCAAVVPVLLGDELPGSADAAPAPEGERTRGNFFAQGCAPLGLPDVAVASVEAELARQLERLGLGAPLKGEVAVAECWTRVVGDHQGLATAGTLKDVLAAAAGAVAKCVALHAPTAPKAEVAASAAAASDATREALLAALAELAAERAGRAAALAERDAARAERDAALAAAK